MTRSCSWLLACGVAGIVVCTSGPAAAQVFSNTGAITINSSGPATPYPSRITVSGVSTVLSGLTVTLVGVGHTFPDDLDIALVGPTGAVLILQSDCGGSAAMGSVTYTISDAGAAQLPDAGSIAAGTYRPADFEAGEAFPALALPSEAPSVGEGGAKLASVFGGTDPNGVWSLYVVDDASGDSGIIQGGWSITLLPTPVELQKLTID